MLGRLLHLGSGSQATAPTQTSNNSPRPILSLESVQEDIHTRNLLFPDAQALYQHRNDQVFPLSTAPATPSASTANAYDYSDDVELDVRDVRIIVMQDALGPANASLLFDSHPLPGPPSPPERSSSGQESRRTPASSRKSSQTQPSRPLVIQSDGPQPRQGAFDRRASVHSRSQSYVETDSQRAAREYREELATFSSCIFGNSELMAYKGTSTKVHVVPCEPRSSDHSSSAFGDGRSSVGRSSGRSSKLSQSYSSQTVSPTYAPPPIPSTGVTPRHSERKKVLITRLFPVNLSADDSDPNVTPQSRLSDEHNGFPFPPTGDEPTPRKKKPQPKQRRTPMYAVVLVVQLPPSPSRMSSAVPTKTGFRESGSYNDQDLFSSSYNSTRMSGWNLSGSGTYGETTESSFSIDVEDRIDSLTQHWDIVIRTLTHLQSVIATTLHVMLRQADVTSPGPFSASSLVTLPRGGETPRAKPSKSTTKLVSLWPNCLADDANIASEVGLSRSRIVMGISAARVVTGQGRWGIWRDEAIWISKWATAMSQGAFFNNLLTGFLATHTDWLQALCSPSYRRRAIMQKQMRTEDDLTLPARTIIVSDDKMAARRLLFLLSAFLPANTHLPGAARAHRPSTSASFGAFSNSPPTYVVPVLREESLRRKINRRTGIRRASHSRTASQSTRAPAVPAQLAHLSMDRNHQRRASDAASIRTANLPIPGNNLVSRKSSAATTATIMPETTTPHFTSVQRSDSQRRQRPGSSNSVAADDLKRSLKRGDSSGTITCSNPRPTSQGLKWGSIMSGLWSPRRRESVDSGSGYSQISELRSPVKANFGRSDQFSEMIRKMSLTEDPSETLSSVPSHTTRARDVNTPRDTAETNRRSFAQPDRTPDPTGAFESPVKTSINADDGVIDVDVPFPDYIASFESAISSPSSSGYLSTPGLPGALESFEHSGRISIDGDLPLNAAGWLNRFHPDFALQATPPQEDLLDKVKAALRAEPTPALLHTGVELLERWVDVSSAVIADTTTSSVTRIIYRRLIKPRAPLEKSLNNGAGPILTPSCLPNEIQLDEEWLEESVTNADDSLTDALERVISFNTDFSKDISLPSSRAHSDVRTSTDSDGTMPDTISEVTQMADPPLDTPRIQCKTVVLSSLEETIRDVIERREQESQKNGTGVKKTRSRRNVLRDAVRHWASNLDLSE